MSTPPRGQLLAHLHQHEVDRWNILNDQQRPYFPSWENVHPRPLFNPMHGTKRATLEALHESFHRFHPKHVRHAHPAGYDFLHLIVEDPSSSRPTTTTRPTTTRGDTS